MNEIEPRPDGATPSGTDRPGAGGAVASLVSVLERIDPGRPLRSVLRSGHYASILALDDRTGIAICTDGVGTKVIVAAQARRFETVGIDCVAMNVNDLVCVGAEPIALVDYIALERPTEELLQALALGLRAGAEEAGVEIPGGELAELPELIRGHPSPHGFDLVGACFGTVPLDRIVSGDAIEPGDVVIGLPSSGIHSNGLTLARSSLFEHGGYSFGDSPEPLGRTLADELLEPTEIYVRSVLELLRAPVVVTGLAHITGDGLLNLLRLKTGVGYDIDEPLPPQPIFRLIESAAALPPARMYEAFNMGTGFCCIVAKGSEEAALSILRERYPAARRIGRVIDEPDVVRLPSIGIVGQRGGFESG